MDSPPNRVVGPERFAARGFVYLGQYALRSPEIPYSRSPVLVTIW
jgi:hypothetical protein